MSKFLIYIGEGIKFDLDQTIGAITAIDGVANAKLGDFIGAVFECTFSSSEVICRISKDHESLTTDGFDKDSLNFIWQLQNKLPVKLWIVDMNYSFNLEIDKFGSVDELQSAIEAT
jgi:hypothetical protein